MKKEMMENATGVKVTKKASKNVIRSLSVGLAAMMALSTPIATFAEDVDAQNDDGETPEESTTSVSTQKPAAEQVKDIQDNSAKTAADSTSEAKEAVDDVIDAAGDAANGLDEVANQENEDGTKTNIAQDSVNSVLDDIEDISTKAKETDAALSEANKKAEEVNDVVDDTAKEQQEAKDALDEATGRIESATSVEEAQNAYNEAAGIAGNAQTAYDKAKETYDALKSEYDDAVKKLEESQKEYDNAVANAQADIQKAKDNLTDVQAEAEALYEKLQKAQAEAQNNLEVSDEKKQNAEQMVKELEAEYENAKKAVEKAQADLANTEESQKELVLQAKNAVDNAQNTVTEKETAQKEAEKAKNAHEAALKIIELENERAKDTSTNWRKEDELFKVILQNYYMPEVIKGELVDCKWEWDKGNADNNYCKVTYKDANNEEQTLYLNYRINNKGDDIIIFEKNEEVVTPEKYVIKDENGRELFEVQADELDNNSLKENGYTQYKDENGCNYTIVKIQSGEKTLYYAVKDNAATDADEVEISTEYDGYDKSNTKITYSIDEDGKLVKTVSADVSKITYTSKKLNADDYTFANRTDADTIIDKIKSDEATDKSDLSVGIKASSSVKATYEQTFTTTIDLSNLAIQIDAIPWDGDGKEKDNVKEMCKYLLDGLTSKSYWELLLKKNGYTYVDSDLTGESKASLAYSAENRAYDHKGDRNTYKILNTGVFTISYKKIISSEASDSVDQSSYTGTSKDISQKVYENACTKAAETAQSDEMKNSNSLKDSLYEMIQNLLAGSDVAKKTNATLKVDNTKYSKKSHKPKDEDVKDFGSDTTKNQFDASGEITYERTKADELSFYCNGTYTEKKEDSVKDAELEKYKYDKKYNVDHKEAETALIGNANYDNYIKSGKTDKTGILLTDKNEENYLAFKQAALDALANYEKAQQEYKDALDARKIAEQNYNDALKNQNDQSKAAQNDLAEARQKEAEAQADYELAVEVEKNAKQNYDNAKKEYDASLELANKAKAAVEAVTKAKADVDSLNSQLINLLTSQNYTADQVKELEGQISAAEAKLKEAEEKAASLTDDLEIAEKTLADKIADLTPAPTPAPGEGGSTTNPAGGETTPAGTPSGGETAPAGTPTGTAATPTVLTTTAVAAETALADAAPIEIAETPVALAATAPTAVATAAGTNNAANANADANADDNVVIEDEETPLADNGAQDEETTSITDEATPLAAEAGAMETMKQEKMSWWWLLIIALLGVTGEEMYRRNKKKKAEAAEKNEK